MGEWGRRKGTDFEQSIAAMLTYLGFKILAENISIKCVDQGHHTPGEHPVDFLAQHIGPLPRPYGSFDGLTFFDCTSSEKIPEDDFKKISETLECLRKTPPYTETKGAIFVVTKKMTPPLRENLGNYQGILAWDLDRLSLYGRLAELYPLRKRCRYHSGESMIYVLYEPVRDVLPRPTFAFLFYDEDGTRLNRDTLRNALGVVRNMAFSWSSTSVRVHSLSGYTSDIPMVLDETAKEFSSWFRRVRIPHDELFDYTRPWFAAVSSSSS